MGRSAVRGDRPADPENWALWQLHNRRTAPHGGETDDDVVRRVEDTLNTIAERHPANAAFVASHGGVIGRILSIWLNTPARVPENCEVNVVDVNGNQRRLIETFTALSSS